MRQTSRAVALLLVLESAQAAITTLAIAAPNTNTITETNPVVIVSNVERLQNRQAPYNQVLPSVGGTMSWGTVVFAKSVCAVDAANQAASGKIVSSTCMLCLNKAGVWCSNTYSYNNTSNALTSAETTANIYTGIATTQAEQVAGTGVDGGTCCGTTTNFSAYTGTIGVAAALPLYTNSTSNAAGGVIMAANSCIAVKQQGTYPGTGSTGTFGQIAWDDATTTFTSWWCSNGLYKRVTGSATGSLNVSAITPLGNNQRLELAQVACPQISSFCGGGSVVQDLASAQVSTAPTQIQILKTSLLTAGDKCTWVAKSVAFAPTFTISKGATAGGIGLATQNWTIHHMEYTANTATYSADTQSLQARAVDATSTKGDMGLTIGVNHSNWVPLFDMPAVQFATLRTWYGAGSVTPGTAVKSAANFNKGELDNWYAPYQNSSVAAQVGLAAIASQYYGNVANFPSSKYSATTPTATSSYGKTDTSTLTTVAQNYDVRVVRYMPAQVAQMSHATGTALSTLYAGKLTSYNTAKATWDAYVAILAKNAKTDAFAAAFSPPKAPTVPPLPNMPWTPATYSGYLKQTPAQAAIQAVNTLGGLSTNFVESAQPTNQQIWYNLGAAQSIGGWGTFTAQILTYRESWGKSFGTIGYSGDANKLLMSQVWKREWMCGVASTTTPTPLAACDGTYSSATATAAGTPVATTNNTTVNFIVAISLWSLGDTQGAGTTWKWKQSSTGQQSFAINWSASVFSTTLQNLSAIAAPTAATAASSLTGLAGAQALAASTAAALAAAALY